jgi:hypothetical protein
MHVTAITLYPEQISFALYIRCMQNPQHTTSLARHCKAQHSYTEHTSLRTHRLITTHTHSFLFESEIVIIREEVQHRFH